MLTNKSSTSSSFEGKTILVMAYLYGSFRIFCCMELDELTPCGHSSIPIAQTVSKDFSSCDGSAAEEDVQHEDIGDDRENSVDPWGRNKAVDNGGFSGFYLREIFGMHQYLRKELDALRQRNAKLEHQLLESTQRQLVDAQRRLDIAEQEKQTLSNCLRHSNAQLQDMEQRLETSEQEKMAIRVKLYLLQREENCLEKSKKQLNEKEKSLETSEQERKVIQQKLDLFDIVGEETGKQASVDDERLQLSDKLESRLQRLERKAKAEKKAAFKSKADLKKCGLVRPASKIPMFLSSHHPAKELSDALRTKHANREHLFSQNSAAWKRNLQAKYSSMVSGHTTQQSIF